MAVQLNKYQVPWVLDGKLRERFRDQESASMVCMPQHEKYLKIETTQEDDNSYIQGNSGISIVIRMPNMDNKTLEKKIDGCYTRMLTMVLDVSWKEKRTNQPTTAGRSLCSTRRRDCPPTGTVGTEERTTE